MLDALYDATPIEPDPRWRRPPLRTLAAFYAGPVALLAAVLAMRMWAGTPISYFTRDPAALLGGSPYAGVVSQCGAILWCAAAACCLFAWAVVRRTGRGATEPAGFLLGSGVLSAVLLFDDQFELHESLFRSSLHVPEVVVYAAYAVALGALLWRYRDLVRRSEHALLLAAVGLFGVSAAADVALPRNSPLHYLVEDGCKFLGIATWFTYLARTAVAVVEVCRVDATETARADRASLTRPAATHAGTTGELGLTADAAPVDPAVGA